MKFQFTLTDILLVTVALAVYLSMFMWVWNVDAIPKAMMVGGGSMLLFGRVFQVCIMRRFPELFERTKKHEKFWLVSCAIGILSIVLAGIGG
jgi:membrane protein YdbS with pleckstrin-like domain